MATCSKYRTANGSERDQDATFRQEFLDCRAGASLCRSLPFAVPYLANVLFPKFADKTSRLEFRL
jgi:hypothetical protein